MFILSRVLADRHGTNADPATFVRAPPECMCTACGVARGFASLAPPCSKAAKEALRRLKADGTVVVEGSYEEGWIREVQRLTSLQSKKGPMFSDLVAAAYVVSAGAEAPAEAQGKAEAKAKGKAKAKAKATAKAKAKAKGNAQVKAKAKTEAKAIQRVLKRPAAGR
mmetsp:Transcript_44884/g.127097  ORF Transcript_44884/g.127097 Transcript_44884/m.127097 type:complete len:166 (+) Transcript_44884:98-595(+)